jgi:lysophospholipase L1-like esterase
MVVILPTKTLRGSRTVKTSYKLAAGVLLFTILSLLASNNSSSASTARPNQKGQKWIGTWAAAAQPSLPKVQTYHNQTLRLIVHVSAGGSRVRIKVSNTYGDHPLLLGETHIARRTTAAEIDPATDRAVKFQGRLTTTVAPRATVVSDPVELWVPALSDLAISLFLPESTPATTIHNLAKQTSYVSAETGDHTADVKFPVDKTTRSWPFLTGVDVAASSRGAAIVAFGSSLTDGDGTTTDTNRRFPDVLAERLQRSADGKAEFGILNEGIIGNRLINDSPRQALDGRFGRVLGEAGLTRFERDALDQAGVRYVIVGLGINDIAFPGSITPATEKITAQMIIAGYRQLIARAHRRGIKIIGTTNPPIENGFLELPAPAAPITFYTLEKENVRQQVNSWILTSGAFDAVVDLDSVLRDPSRPSQLLPAYDSGDHIHPNIAGCVAEANAFPLAMFN